MNIAYSWLKEYIDIDLTPDELGAALTQIGLETGSIEEVETVKGGLKGLVIGEVLTCEPHPNSDHLSKTTVNVGNGEPLAIVCGAPNVAAGQKVVVATIGTVLYDGDSEFVIKQSKIRGEVSMGMICAEDEIGLGKSHAGIMVLPANAVVGTLASEYFNIKSDYVLEVDLTPNRIDAGSHIGIARDLAAFLSRKKEVKYTRPDVSAFKIDNKNLQIPVELLNPEACHRYAGVTISGIEIKESPEWLKNRLKLIGLNPINNVVDVTNYVLFETGQPLHAFDADEIKGGKVVVRTLEKGTKFITLDGAERELNENDLMICNDEEGMCIGGVFGGSKSGVKESTTAIFLESAWFDPIFIRKTARRHGLNTDASFRFERGTDPNGVLYALKRAALLIKECAGGEISSDIVDIYPEVALPFEVTLRFANVKRLIGEDLGAECIKGILSSLEIEIVSENSDELQLKVPRYRVDVQREADVIEDILRIYGYNNIAPGVKVNSTLQYARKPEPEKVKNNIASFLSGNDFMEIMSNSLTKSAYYDNCVSFPSTQTVRIVNPLSSDLNAMRQTLLFSGLEAVAYNSNRQSRDLKFYELGNTYFFKGKNEVEKPVMNYFEEYHLGLFITGNKKPENWSTKTEPTSFYELKMVVEALLRKVGLSIEKMEKSFVESDLFDGGLVYKANGGKIVVEFGFVHPKYLKLTDIDAQVLYADVRMDFILQQAGKNKLTFAELPKYPAVRRDLALLVDEAVTYEQLKDIAYRTERKLLREVDIFDVYKGKNLPEGKKSYALSYILRDDERTLDEKTIEKTMQKLIANYEREVDAKTR